VRRGRSARVPSLDRQHRVARDGVDPDHLVVDARAGLDDAADDVHVIGPLMPLAIDTTDAEAEPAGMVASAPTLASSEPPTDDPR
jgi:hypothetical protein